MGAIKSEDGFVIAPVNRICLGAARSHFGRVLLTMGGRTDADGVTSKSVIIRGSAEEEEEEEAIHPCKAAAAARRGRRASERG